MIPLSFVSGVEDLIFSIRLTFVFVYLQRCVRMVALEHIGDAVSQTHSILNKLALPFDQFVQLPHLRTTRCPCCQFISMFEQQSGQLCELQIAAPVEQPRHG